VESIQIGRVAFPGDRVVFGSKLEVDDIGDRAGGAMLAGNPLWVEKRQGSGSRRNVQLYVNQFARRVPGIHSDANYTLLSPRWSRRQPQEHPESCHILHGSS